MRTVDLEEDHSGGEGVRPRPADAVPGLAAVPPAVVRLHVRDGPAPPEAKETTVPVEAEAAVFHRGVGFTAAGEDHRRSSEDVPARTDGQADSVGGI